MVGPKSGSGLSRWEGVLLPGPPGVISDGDAEKGPGLFRRDCLSALLRQSRDVETAGLDRRGEGSVHRAPGRYIASQWEPPVGPTLFRGGPSPGVRPSPELVRAI